MKVSNKSSQINSMLKKAEFINLDKSSSDTVHVYPIQMTKAIAQNLLDNNLENQRSLSLNRSKKYASEMLSDNWKFNGECITVDNEGRLLNGQHRCKAVVLADVSIPVLVITGIETEAFKTMDQGFKRSTGQIFSMAGVRNSSLIAASLKSYYGYLKSGCLYRTSELNTSTLELEKIYNEDNERFDEVVCLSNRSSGFLKFSGFTATMICSLMMAIKDDPKADEFINRFNNQDWVSQDKCPIKFIHNVITKARSNKMKLTQKQKYNAIVTAWNHFKQGKGIPFNSYLWLKSEEAYKIK